MIIMVITVVIMTMTIEFGHLAALVVQLLPVEAAHQVALDEHPEVPHLGHFGLLLEKLVNARPENRTYKDGEPIRTHLSR